MLVLRRPQLWNQAKLCPGRPLPLQRCLKQLDLAATVNILLLFPVMRDYMRCPINIRDFFQCYSIIRITKIMTWLKFLPEKSDPEIELDISLWCLPVFVL